MSTDETRGLLGEHEIIRAHVNFLTNSLRNLDTRSGQVKERMRNYRSGLYDLRDGVKRHIELDERILRVLPDSLPIKETFKEHQEIQKLLDDAIQLADRAAEGEHTPEELSRYASQINEAFSLTRRIIEEHISREDEILKLIQRGT